MTSTKNTAFSTKQNNDFPPELDALISELNGNLLELMAALEASEISSLVWNARFEEILVRYHIAAYMAGQGSPELTAADIRNISGYASVQLEFLDNFRLVIQSAGEFQRGWANRAAMYAGGIAAPYWKGKTKVLPLPAMPGDGTTQCLSNDRCVWDVETVDEDAGDYDAYWVLDPQAEHCQTCLERSVQWNPLEIRGGRIVTPIGILTT